MKGSPKSKGKHNYVFPKTLAQAMAKVDTQVQYEATMLSLVFILIGIITTSIYSVLYMGLTPFMKVMVVINAMAGFIFLSSSLVTSYQQYKNYLEVKELGL